VCRRPAAVAGELSLSREPGRGQSVQFHVRGAVNRAAKDVEVKDAELVHRAQGGDAAAFAALVSRYQDRVYNTCYRMCHHHADALDATQTTFLKALEGLGRFQARSSFFTWLFRIAVNVVISERRTRRRRPAISLHEANPDGPEREPAVARDNDPFV
jgi:RNA polymerase sigma-70 factor (ECF subfamily)